MANPQNPKLPTKQNPEEQAILQTQPTQGPTATRPSYLDQKDLMPPRTVVTSDGARKRVMDNIQYIKSLMPSQSIKMQKVKKNTNQ